MNSKIDIPFIYFLFEENENPFVAVYHVTSSLYMTTADFNLSSDWDFYSIKDGEDLEAFQHTDSHPVEGYSIFLSEEQIRIIVEQINTGIHMYNKLPSSQEDMKKRVDRFHLLASESDAGSLRVALGASNTIIPIPGFFAIGPVWRLLEKEGINYRNEWLYDHINFEMEDSEYEQRFINSLRCIKDIPEDMPLYIWHGRNAEEQTALRFLLYLLKNQKNEIILIDSSSSENTPLGQLSSSEIRALFKAQQNNQPLHTEERSRLLQEWEELSESKAVLRVWQDGALKAVPEHIYDNLILEAVQTLQESENTNDFIRAANVIFHVFSKAGPFIDIHFLEYRLRHLVYTGKLALKGVPKSMRHYRVRLR